MIHYSYESARVFNPSGMTPEVIYRPVATIRLIGPGGERRLAALVDTGSATTLIPFTFVDLLGIHVRNEAKEDILGIGATSTSIWYAMVNLGIVTPGGGSQ